MSTTITSRITITKVTRQLQVDAKNLVLEGFKERFGFIDHSFNPDLKNILNYYNKDGCAFFVGILHNQVICTGALTKERIDVGRIERMSVKKEFRRQGIAQMILLHLENYARDIGYCKLVMETNKKWESAINLYKNNGYTESNQDAERVYLMKDLS